VNLELLPRRPIETVDRRVLGAFQFVDAVTSLPVVVAGAVDVRGATVGGTPIDVGLHGHAVQLRQNRAGLFVVFSAPLFAAYTSAADDPVPPPELAADPLRLRLALTDAGRYYLPQEFVLDLPRALDPGAPDAVFRPLRVELFRSPGAPAQHGWALLRVLVTEAGVVPPRRLPGVLIRVFRSPRGTADRPIGVGMTEWRGGVAGEALVPVADLQRFRPGSGPTVIERDQAIEFEVSRHSGFDGAAGQLPDVPALLAGTGDGLIRPAASQISIVRPATPPPFRVQAGREFVVQLAMP
jgi:hypothetical protein